MINERDVMTVLPSVDAGQPGEHSFLSHFCRYSYVTCDGSIVYALGAALTVLSVYIPPHVTVHLGTAIPGVYWGLLVGDSASRKTAIAKNCLKILEEVSPELLGSAHESSASLMEAISERPQQLMTDTEMGNFLASTRQGSYKSDMKEKLMETWDGGRITKTSLRGGSFVVENPRVSWLACVAPELIEKHTTDTEWTGGFFSRFLVFMASKKERNLLPPPEWPEGREFLVDLLRYKSQINIGPCMGFTEDTVELLKGWSERIEKEAESSPEGRHTAGVYGRMTTMAIKTALVLSLDFGSASESKGYPWRIGRLEMTHAIAITELHMRSAIHLVSQLALSPFERQRRAILEATAQGGTLQQILQRTKPRMLKRPTLEVLETLEADGTLVKEIDATYGPMWRPANSVSPASFGDTGQPLQLYGAYAVRTEPELVLPSVTELEPVPPVAPVVYSFDDL